MLVGSEVGADEEITIDAEEERTLEQYSVEELVMDMIRGAGYRARGRNS